MDFTYKRHIFGFECDIYGHLNNAQYLHLFEEARSMALVEVGVTVEDFRQMDIQLIITRAEVDYKRSVQLDDDAVIVSRFQRMNRLRCTWEQIIYDSSQTLCSRAIIEGVFVRNGKPTRVPQELQDKFKPYL